MSTPAKDKPLSSTEVKAALKTLASWKHERSALIRAYEFADFRQAIAFMVRLGFEADGLDHHPEWTNVYNRVALRLSTHSAGNRVTAKDFELARRAERIALSFGAASV